MRRFRGHVFVHGWGYAGGSAGFGGVLQDGHEEFDEQGGGKGCDARARDGALLVEGCVAKRLE
jgi:hypothetical protein